MFSVPKLYFHLFVDAGAFQWESTGDVILHYEQHVPDLDSGTAYQIRVVSKNGADQEAPAEWQEFVTLGVGKLHRFLGVREDPTKMVAFFRGKHCVKCLENKVIILRLNS